MNRKQSKNQKKTRSTKKYIENNFSLEKIASNDWEKISQEFCVKKKEIFEHICIGEITSEFTNVKGTF